MPGLYIRASKFKLDAGSFTKALDEAIKTQMRQAARKFIQAALYEGITSGVPVDTGMAAGTYLNISRMLRIAISIVPRSDRPKKYYAKDEAYGQFKTPELGASLATQYQSIDTIIKKRDSNLYYFEFETKVFHYTLLDQFGIKNNPNSPWQTFQTGRDAFIAYMSAEGIKKLPKVTQYVERTEITVSATGGIKQAKVASDITNTIERGSELL